MIFSSVVRAISDIFISLFIFKGNQFEKARLEIQENIQERKQEKKLIKTDNFTQKPTKNR